LKVTDGQEGADEAQEGDVKAEEKDTGITLEEYYKKTQGAESHAQVNEAKSKVTEKELLKEIGTATKLSTKSDNKIDDKHHNKKIAKVIETATLGLNTEHADLLNFKTGFITFKDKVERKPEDGKKPAEKSDKPAEGAPATTEEESKESKKPEREEKAGGDGRPKKNYNPNWKKDKEAKAEKASLPNVGDDKSFPKLG